MRLPRGLRRLLPASGLPTVFVAGAAPAGRGRAIAAARPAAAGHDRAAMPDRADHEAPARLSAADHVAASAAPARLSAADDERASAA
ncbi:hypothetical protein [Candidatus Solirubrobacter pratensis]|uniref:hypothetical protein n=1 Tax=Candidatus Solirubrobacter pratensis TaxID=1298857 RepID=UPI00041D5EBD|nr:hypothetical protein [Candidatus Solirubrobacter pratensis]